MYCSNCRRETKRHYSFCKVCGKRQLFLLDRVDDPPDSDATLTNAQRHALQFSGGHIENELGEANDGRDDEFDENWVGDDGSEGDFEPQEQDD